MGGIMKSKPEEWALGYASGLVILQLALAFAKMEANL